MSMRKTQLTGFHDLNCTSVMLNEVAIDSQVSFALTVYTRHLFVRQSVPFLGKSLQ